jgi:uridine phosphorylase
VNHTLVLAAPTYQEYAVVRAAVEDLVADDRLEVQACGMGQASVTTLCQRLDAKVGSLRGLALVGWAGGLSPSLSAGEVVLADAAIDLDGESVPCTAVRLPGAKVGPMLTVPAPLLTPEAKSAVWRRGVLAAEMEAYPLALWGRKHGLPFVHARVILDPANESLPDLGDALDPLGRPRWRSLAPRLARRPSLGVALLRLAHRVRALRPVLSQVARAVVQAFEA